MCDVLKTNPVFKKCETVVDVSPFIEACKYDMCADENSNHRDLYRCRAVAAYAHECANRGVILNWFDREDLLNIKTACYNSKYGKCYGGSSYSECAKQVNSTCKDFFTRSTEKFSSQNSFCVAGCSCPEGQVLDKIGSNYMCVEKSSCTCYDFATEKYYKPGESIKKACSTW